MLQPASNPILVGMGCCEVNGLNRVFSGPLVRREVRAFKRKGLNKRQAQFVGELKNAVGDSSVREFGCGVEAEFLVFGDEGHGLIKLANKLVAYPAIVDFLDRQPKA